MNVANRKWSAWVATPWWPAMPLLVVQLLSGLWYLPQLSFFPIYLQEGLGYGPVAIGGFVAAGQVAGMIAGLTGGVLGDALGSKRVLLLGLVCFAVASLVFQISLPWLVAILWIIGGFGVGFHTLGGSSYLTGVADPRYLGMLSASYALCLTLGGALGNPLAGAVLEARGFRAFGAVGLAITIAAMIWTSFMLSGRSADRQGPKAARLGVFQRGALSLVRRPVPLILIGLRYLPTVLYGMMGMLIPLMINSLAGSSALAGTGHGKTTVAIYATVTLIVASGAQLLAGRAADRFGRRWPLFTGYGALILAALGLAATSQQLWGVFLFGVLGNAAAWALAALMFCLVSDGVPRNEHPRMFGVLHASWSLGMISGSLLGGVLVRIAPGLPFLVGGLLQLVTITLALVYFARVARAPELSTGE